MRVRSLLHCSTATWLIAAARLNMDYILLDLIKVLSERCAHQLAHMQINDGPCSTQWLINSSTGEYQVVLESTSTTFCGESIHVQLLSLSQ